MIATEPRELTATDNKILQLYSEGLPYRSIQRELRKFTGDSYDKRRLGERMGELKKMMDCQTQFQMGYKYAHNAKNDLIQAIKENCENEVAYQSKLSFQKGTDFGFTQGKIQTEAKQCKSGVIGGLIAATVFWFIIAYAVYYAYYFNAV